MVETINEHSDIQTKALDFVVKAFKKYSDRAGLEDIWEKADKLYNNITTEKYYDGAANLFPPETRRACKTLINFSDEVLFNSDPPFRFKGVGGSNDDKKADIHTKLLLREVDKAKVRSKIRSSLLENIVKYGFVIVFAPYVLKERKAITDAEERKRLRQQLQGKPGLFAKLFGKTRKAEKTRITDFDGTDFEVQDIHSTYWNYFRKWEEQDCIIRRKMVTWEHLKSREYGIDENGNEYGVYFNLDAVKADDALEHNTKEENITEKFDHLKDITGLSSSYDTGKKRYELLEAWCNFDLDGDGIEEECVIGVINQKHIVRLSPNPSDTQRKPLLWACWEPIEGTSLGLGVPQLAEKDQIALNDFTNQIMDNITQILNNMWIVDELADIPRTQLKSRPNGVIVSKAGVDAVKSVEKQLTAAEGFKGVTMCKESIRQTSGATMSLQGLPGNYNTTASEYQQQGAASARDVMAKIRSIEDNIIKEWLIYAYANTLQFRSREEIIKIIGKEAAEAVFSDDMQSVKEALYMDADIIPLGVTQVENKVVKGQQLLNLYNLAVKSPPGIWDLPDVARGLCDHFGYQDRFVLPQPKDTMISPNDENILMSQGETVHAKPMENHQMHIMTHQNGIAQPPFDALFMQHIQEHLMLAGQMQQQLPQPGQEQLGLPPQEQPRLAPETVTEATVGKMTDMPVSPTGVMQ